MRKCIDLSGKIFGKWKVLSKGKNSDRVRWLCECECGNRSLIGTSHLNSGNSKQCRQCSGKLEQDWTKYINQKINSWTILNIVKKKGSNYLQSKCDCGSIRLHIPRTIIDSKIECCNKCVVWKGYGNIPKSFFSYLKSSSKIRKIKFDLTIEYLWNLFLQQDKKCIYSSKELEFGRTKFKNQTASLDRIDSSKGYVEGNVQWVHKDVNMMKWQLSEKVFIKNCHIISKNFKGRYEQD